MESGKKKYAPKLEDIRKQYFYADFIRKINKEHRLKISVTRNDLLLPLSKHLPQSSRDSKQEVLLPFAALGTVLFRGYSPISVLGISLGRLLEMYAGRVELGREEMRELYQLCVDSEITEEESN